jgi:hypothetical protein
LTRRCGICTVASDFGSVCRTDQIKGAATAGTVAAFRFSTPPRALAQARLRRGGACGIVVAPARPGRGQSLSAR